MNQAAAMSVDINVKNKAWGLKIRGSEMSVEDIKHKAWGVKTRGAEISVDDVKHKAWGMKT